MKYRDYRHIIITDKNYRILKRLGNAGDSFNDVISDILEKINSLQQSNGVGAPIEIIGSSHSPSKEEKICQ